VDTTRLDPIAHREEFPLVLNMERQMLHRTTRRRIGIVSAMHHAQGPLDLRDLGVCKKATYE